MAGSLLTPVQQRGREALERLGLPTRREESWRLTDLRRLQRFTDLPIASGAVHPGELPPAASGVLRLVLDGVADPLADVTLPSGLSVLEPIELEQALGHTLDRCGCADAWPVELNHASCHQVLALRGRGELTPLELVICGGTGLSTTRVLLLLEESAHLDLFQVVLGTGASAHSHVLEAHLGQDARLNHGCLATATGESSLLAHVAVEQEPRSHYAFTSVVKGWSFGRLEPRVVQVDGQARTELRGLAVSAAEQQMATHSAVRFDGPDGELDQLQKCLASGRSHAIFNGAIQVPRDAQRTNAAQLSRNLLLSERARIDTKPELEIIADDVRCAHGATVSQLQDDELFYLRSRGISADAAASLLLRGVCQEVIDQLPDAALPWSPLQRVMEGMSP
ncbi:Fe-S cluster assembly protein SufD [Synechococcus sp. CC9616]|uniref:Fe-S cluster assembly protein SufD n=1 Tax=Synechococcus sp. CC9616 TaxID=110663 RepID=UPI00048F4EF7|nr:Fe-S cluster assembly protein SufD [Synechococcus sp. CC9616]